MSSPLERLTGLGKALAVEAPDAKEFEGLVRSGRVRLKDAENLSNSVEGRFDLAYNAAHALCLAALRQVHQTALLQLLLLLHMAPERAEL